MFRIVCWSAMVVGLIVAPARAGVMFFSNNVAGFNAAVTGYGYLGTEDFEESTLADNTSSTFAGPLSQTSTTSPYASGIVQPITVSVNGSGNLAAFNDRLTVATTAVLANTGGATLDWSFDASDYIVAVGLNPVTFSGSNQTRTNTITVYDTSGGLLDTIAVNSNDAGSNHLGILATGSSRIGRINFFGTNPSSGSSISEGGDNAALYGSPIPEPSGWLLAAWALLSLGVRHRR